MTQSTRNTVARVRPMVITALLSTALLAAPLAVFAAEPSTQAPSSKSTPAKPAAGNSDAKAQAVEQRISQMHTELKITPDQEAKWNAVAQAMRDNATSMDKLITERQQQSAKPMTAVEDLEAAQRFAQANVDGLKNLSSAFKTLYDAMSDPQKKNADEIFARLTHPPASGAANHNG